MLSFFYRVQSAPGSLFVHSNANCSFSSMSTRLFASQGENFCLFSFSFFSPSSTAGKDAEIVGRHNSGLPQLHRRSVNNVDGRQTVCACVCLICRAAAARRPRTDRTLVGGSGVHSSGNLTRRPLLDPTWRFFCVSPSATRYWSLLEFTLAHRKRPNTGGAHSF